MYKRKLPPPGQVDPISSIRHYTNTEFPMILLELREHDHPDLSGRRDFLCQLMERFTDGIYQYKPTESFNPKIARQLRDETQNRMGEGATEKGIEELSELYGKTMDDYAIETGQPDKTRKALDEELREEAKAGR